MRKFALILMLLLLIPAASAKYITISVSMPSNNLINESSGELKFLVSNKGDEPAYDVVLSFEFPDGFSSDNLAVGVLAPEKAAVAPVALTVSDDVVPGEYYFNLVVRYSDANGYPFSMVNPAKLVYQKTAQSKVGGSMDSVELAVGDSKNVRLRLANMDDVAHDVKVKLHTPAEITVEGVEERQVSIPAGGEVEVDYIVSSLGALPGSNYLVYAVAEYTNEFHYSSAVRSSIAITPAKNLFGSLAWVLVFVVVVLVLAVAYMQMRPSKSRKR